MPSHIEDLPDNHKTHLIHPLTTVEWAKENKKKYDVFIFLGTTQMKFSNINKTIKDYQESMNISSKYVFIFTIIVYLQLDNMYYTEFHLKKSSTKIINCAIYRFTSCLK